MFRAVLLIALALLGGPAAATLTIHITEGVDGAVPVAVVPFGWNGPESGPPQDVAAIVAGDLARSGRISPLARDSLLSTPQEGDEVVFGDWRLVGADYLVLGRMEAVPEGGYLLVFRLYNVLRGEQIAAIRVPAGADDLRRAAHYISDVVYEAITGEPGVFSTRIAYVTARGQPPSQRYTLQYADADGFNSRTILDSAEPIMSPAWSNDGLRLAYVSFEGRRPAIYVQELVSGKRRVVSREQGVNGAPAWSPDGRSLALTLSRDGNLEIYVLDLATGALRRLTRHYAIDTEPAWMPDGGHIVFTSDRSGGPQLYRVPVEGGEPTRITFEGRYNAAADISHDGRRIAMVHRVADGAFHIAVLDLGSANLRLLTKTAQDESPDFAPNSSMILYATSSGRQGELAAVSVDGRFHQRLFLQEGDVREPAWSPLPPPQVR